MKMKKSMRRVVSGSAALLTIHEIMHWKKSKQQASGVYFLLNEDTIQYIGSSINVYSRIAQHIANKVVFDAATIEFCAEHLMLHREGMYITQYNPPLNRQIPQWDGRNTPLARQDNESWRLTTGVDYAIDD